MPFGGGSGHGLYADGEQVPCPAAPAGTRKASGGVLGTAAGGRQGSDQFFGSSRNCGILRVVFFWYSA